MVAVKHEPIPIVPPCPKPRCPLCGSKNEKLTRLTTRTSNRNGNAGRPYLKCLPCQKFVTFDDERGIHPVNRQCGCGKPSRIQVAGQRKGRTLHFVCGSGECEFYDVAEDENGERIGVPDDMVKKLANLALI